MSAGALRVAVATTAAALLVLAVALGLHARGAGVPLGGAGADAGTCQRDPLRHVYRPQRLQVLQRCADVTGTVFAWRHEPDGDYHVQMAMDAAGWTNQANAREQHGRTVVEFVPGDPRPPFHAGQRLRLRGTKVLDRNHGWIELHPVFTWEAIR